MDIKQTTEDVMSAAGDPTPRTSKREVNTSVVVGDGETIILGGMIKETERSLKRRVPGLSYIPLIGGLFQKISKEKEKVDFVIFLTPQIIENQDQMREATRTAAGFSNQFDLRTQKGVSVDLPVSTLESDIDSRFREMYQKSLRRK